MLPPLAILPSLSQAQPAAESQPPVVLTAHRPTKLSASEVQRPEGLQLAHVVRCPPWLNPLWPESETGLYEHIQGPCLRRGSASLRRRGHCVQLLKTPSKSGQPVRKKQEEEAVLCVQFLSTPVGGEGGDRWEGRCASWGGFPSRGVFLLCGDGQGVPAPVSNTE